MFKISFKNVGTNGVTKDMTLKSNLFVVNNLIIRKEVSGLMNGRPFEIGTSSDMEFGIYYAGVLAGSFTVTQL